MHTCISIFVSTSFECSAQTEQGMLGQWVHRLSGNLIHCEGTLIDTRPEFSIVRAMLCGCCTFPKQ
jgi:hypothetical protein